MKQPQAFFMRGRLVAQYLLEGVLFAKRDRAKGAMPFAFLVLMLLCLPLVSYAMTPISDGEMAHITGRALLVSDYIAPHGISGVTDPNSSKIGFYRMGLDAKVSLNMNIDKLQLGCGGYNQAIKSGCDINIDYVRLMGLNSAGDGPGDPVTSDFTMKRPYVELAVQNPKSPTKREVVGFKFGAQSVNGYMGIGRRYKNGQVNQENGGTCSSSSPLNCNSGLNTVSGYLHTEMSGNIPITNATFLNINSSACFGKYTGSNATARSNCGGQPHFYHDVTGTRIHKLDIPSIPLKMNICLFGNCLSGYSHILENLRFIHGFSVKNTSNFFLSFERQPVAYPTYDKKGYSHMANTGWWMNIPDLKALNINGAPLNNLSFGQLLDALGKPGVKVVNTELNMTPPKNCYGNYKFC